jgi:hypothetical protein
LEAPSQLGRCERHGGIFKDNLLHVVTVHKVIGKKAMKMAAAVSISCKNEMMRKGGIAPCQCVRGKFPRGVGHLLEEEEWGQLGVVQNMMDSTTEFGLRSKYRLDSRTKYVEQDCSRRAAGLTLRKSVPMPMNYRQGDLVCYIKRQGAATAEEVWRGPARVIGADNRVIWVMHGGIPVATAAHKMRPATTTEMLAYQVSSRNMVPFDANDPGRMPQEQEGFIDATGFPDGVPSRGGKRLEPGAEERVPRPPRRGGKGLSWPSFSSTQPMPGLRDGIDDDHRLDSAYAIMDRGGAVKTKNGLLYHPVKRLKK